MLNEYRHTKINGTGKGTGETWLDSNPNAKHWKKFKLIEVGALFLKDFTKAHLYQPQDFGPSNPLLEHCPK